MVQLGIRDNWTNGLVPLVSERSVTLGGGGGGGTPLYTPYRYVPTQRVGFLRRFGRRYRIVFKILLLTFKAIHKLAPTYISELVSPKDTGDRYYLRSNNDKLLNIPPCKSLSTLGDRSFYMAAPKLWNDLPLFIRNISSVNAFKKALKTHLFQKAFPS